MRKGDMRETVWTIGVFILLIIGVLVFFRWTSGMVITEFSDEIKIGDEFTGRIFIKNDKITDANLSSSVIIILSLSNETVVAETATLKDVIDKSYKNPNGYYIRLEDMINYTFKSAGVYELTVYAPDAGILIKEKFKVTDD